MKISITPGAALNYYSDFEWHAFPGIDLGWRISNHWQAYGNVGYTYRIPTYTDLYYSDPTTLGNENLLPENALSQELGIRFVQEQWMFSAAAFNRDADDLIDYVKTTEQALWEARNIRELNTKGVEIQANYGFKTSGLEHKLTSGYTYLKDDLKNALFEFSRYSINSLKHHFTWNYQAILSQKTSFYVAYRYAERSLGDAYQLVDLGWQWQLEKFRLNVDFNNIFNESYSETNLVPMPKRNGRVGIRYVF